MKVHFYGKTDVGVVRTNNEDSFGAFALPGEGYLFVVADGLGGHLAGEVASSTAVQKLKEYLSQAPSGDLREFLDSVYRHLNREIYTLGQSNPSRKGMGTTLTALYIKDNQAYIAHVGDSRVYRITSGGIELLTQDQSFVEKLVSNGLLSQEEAKKHPRKNVLLQMIGMKKDVEPQIIGPFPVREGDKFLLCTDGLSNLVMDREIYEIISRLPLINAVEFLVEAAKKRGGPDNITAVAVAIGEVKLKITPVKNPPVKTDSTRELPFLKRRGDKRKKRVILVAVVLALLLLLSLGYYLFTLSKKGEGPGKPQTPSSTLQEKGNGGNGP